MASLPRLVTHLLVLLALNSCVSDGCFLITTPRRWTAGLRNIVCAMVSEPSESASLGITLWKHTDLLRYRATQYGPITRYVNITLNPGEVNSCVSVYLPKATTYKLLLRVQGRACGKNVFKQFEVTIAKPTFKIFIQTDKYRYKPGQQVHFRIFAIEKVTLFVSEENYSMVWITAPSGTRIAQWRNVDNSMALVHLTFQLIDEPEMGQYTINVQAGAGGYNTTFQTYFRVEEYVLPRFEVNLTTPSFITLNDNYYNFTVCGRYTFGQPVQGMLSLKVVDTDCEASVTNTAPIDGCLEMKVESPFNINRWDCRGYRLIINATLTENGTLTSVSRLKHVQVTPFLVSFTTIHQDTYMKPHLPFIAKVRVQHPDDTPASGEPVEVCCLNACSNVTSGEDGTINIVVPYCTWHHIMVRSLICWRRIRSSEMQLSYTRFYSPSNSSLAIVAPEEALRCSKGQYQERQVKLHVALCNHAAFTLNIMVVSRGVIQYIGSAEMDTREMEPLDLTTLPLPKPLMPPNCYTLQTYFNISVSRFVSPVIRVVVWYTRDDGEVVSDARMMEVEKCFNYQVQLALDSPLPMPGALASYQLDSEPNTVCSLGVVDKSTELLTPENIRESSVITIDTVFKLLDQYQQPEPFDNTDHVNQYCRKQLGEERVFWKTYTTNYVDSLQAFDDSGLHVMTDAIIETRPCQSAEMLPPSAGPLPLSILPLSFQGTPAAPDAGRTRMFQKMPDAPRTYFPETWLWNLIVVPSSGRVGQALELPDTITQWVGSAVCIHDSLGVGISNKAFLTTFKALFVDLTLPPTIKQSEILHVKVSVFNYVNETLPITSSLYSPHLDNDKLEMVDPQNPFKPGVKSFCVPPNQKVVHTVKVRPRVSIGLLNLTAHAIVDNLVGLKCVSTSNYSDTIIKPIKVVARGFPREITNTDYLCPDKDIEDRLKVERTISNPPDMVPGTFRSWITVSGDLMALSIENLGNLIKMPMGCGEQILLNLAPNIFILDYLTSSQQDIPHHMRVKLITFMATGYRRELKYRHPDGSFSAFGSSDRSGSTWLTAFVLKSFGRARPYIQVDEDYLLDAQKWLFDLQDHVGCFRQVGRVINQALKGGLKDVDTAVSLTAYVTIALLEAAVGEKEDVAPRLRQALMCLIRTPSTDLYTMAIKSYALALADLPQARNLISKLLTINDGRPLFHSEETIREQGSNGPGSGPKASATAVEGVAYVVLAMMTIDPALYRTRAATLVKWIAQQRNGQGGFVSTQATVVALQALALFSTYTATRDISVTLTLNSRGLDRSITVNHDNKFLQQLVKIPVVPTTLAYRAQGKGCAVVQSVIRYSVENPSPSEVFDLSVKTSTEIDLTCITKRFSACVAYLLEDSISNMAIIEVHLVSGYQPMMDDLLELMVNNTVIKRYELEDEMVAFYIDHFESQESVCLSFRMVREATVEKVQPSTVDVYDYYQPNFRVSQSYSLPPFDECFMERRLEEFVPDMLLRPAIRPL